MSLSLHLSLHLSAFSVCDLSFYFSLHLFLSLSLSLQLEYVFSDDLEVLVENVTEFIEYISRHKETLFAVEVRFIWLQK